MLLSGLRLTIVMQVKAPEDLEARTVGHWKGILSLSSFQNLHHSYEINIYFICGM